MFLTTCYAQVRVRIRRLEMLVFRKVLCTYLMDDPKDLSLSRIIPERLFQVFNRSEKCPLWDASSQGNVRRAFAWWGKCPSGMFLVGDVSGRRCVWLGKCPSGMCLVGEMSVGDVSGNLRKGFKHPGSSIFQMFSDKQPPVNSCSF